ncbi:MAG: ferric reductase-like transmembrane domain-containing protein [Nocardioides sp.]|uniref:2Fe-2S iron-sulfur cluster-binding protein n=1 Tax=Nocardioides sp. TaxID=35761 RepID=UPI0039E52924
MDPQLWWHVARASGLTAWVLLSASVLWGLLLSTRVLGNRPAPAWLLDLHRLLGALTVVFVLVHMVGLYIDRWIDYGIADLLIPLRSEYRPTAVAWGVVTFYLLTAIAVTSWLRPRIPESLWRWIHRLAFAAFVASTLHLLQAGTDRRNRYLLAVVVVVAAAFAFLCVYRLLAGRRPPAALGPGGGSETRDSASPERRLDFYPLTVRDARNETADSVSIAFEVPADLAERFRFEPGQFVTLKALVEGQEMRRPYSICSGIADGELRIAVRHGGSGTFSGWLTTEVTVGTVIEVCPPQGRFTTVLNPLRSRRVLGVAAGSGITPVISIVRSILAIEPRSSAVLLLGNRDADSVMLRDELIAVEANAAGRLTVVHLYSRDPGAPSHQLGRIDSSRLAAPALEHLDFPGFDEAFLCGPRGMMSEVRTFLESVGVGSEAIHAETFEAARRRHGEEIARRPGDSAPGSPLSVIIGGVTTRLSPLAGETVLDAGLRGGLDLPYSCLSGACGTCVARVVSGECESGDAELTTEERAAGVIRTCTAIPRGDGAVIQF